MLRPSFPQCKVSCYKSRDHSKIKLNEWNPCPKMTMTVIEGRATRPESCA